VLKHGTGKFGPKELQPDLFRRSKEEIWAVRRRARFAELPGKSFFAGDHKSKGVVCDPVERGRAVRREGNC